MSPRLIIFLKFFTKMWSNFHVKSVTSCQVLILSLDFVVSASNAHFRPCFAPPTVLVLEITSDPPPAY